MVDMVDPRVGSGTGFDAERAYAVEVDPEFPAKGTWDCDVYAFDRDGMVVPEFVARWGAPTLVQVTPKHGTEWVGMYPAGGLGALRGVYATPSPNTLCVVVGGAAYLTDVDRPSGSTQLATDQVEQVVATSEHQLLLLVSPVDMVAVGSSGVAWRSHRLAMDHLRVTRVMPRGIECTDDLMDPESTRFIVDPTTGRSARTVFGRDFPRTTPL